MQRQKQLTDWLSGLYPNENFTIAPASADASFRRYFRATFADGTTKIVMDAPPQHEDCKPFLHVGKLFEDAGTHVPHVYAQDLVQGFLLLSDLGNTTYLQALNAADNARRALRRRNRRAHQNSTCFQKERAASLRRSPSAPGAEPVSRVVHRQAPWRDTQ